jgi:hypothetical protein
MTFSALLNTVSSTANTVTATLDTVSTAVGMATSFVGQAAENQRIRQIADKETFIENLIMEKSEERASLAIKADKFCLKSERHAAHYNEAYQRFTSLLRPEDSKE